MPARHCCKPPRLLRSAYSDFVTGRSRQCDGFRRMSYAYGSTRLEYCSWMLDFAREPGVFLDEGGMFW